MLILVLMLACPQLYAENTGHSDSDYQQNIASQNPGLFQNQTILISGRESYSTSDDNPSYKSERTATTLALFPGFLFHGLGHFYAEDLLTGFVLLGVEVISLPMVWALFDYGPYENTEDDESAYRATLIFTGVLAFFGSWIYDFVHADAAVRSNNRKIRAEISIPENRSGGIELSLAFTF
jgi:hypothetical protein